MSSRARRDLEFYEWHEAHFGPYRPDLRDNRIRREGFNSGYRHGLEAAKVDEAGSVPRSPKPFEDC